MKTCWLIVVMALLGSVLHGAEEEMAKAERLFNEGNSKEAYALYEQVLTGEGEMKTDSLVQALGRAMESLQRINQVQDADALLERVVERHAGNWQVLQAVANQYIHLPHYGFMVAGAFERGQHREGGEAANAMDRDRVRALQLMMQALPLAEEATAPERFKFYRDFASHIVWYRGYSQVSWRLQYLTDLDELPDYEPGYGYYHRGQTQGAPVDEEGNPVFYSTPRGLEQAQNDGERWRWMQAMAMEAQPAESHEIRWEFASFLYQQFGVHTLAQYGFYHHDAGAENKTSLTALHTLSDDETMARLATGIKRFELPAEFNYIRIFRELQESALKQGATNQLGQVYLNRRQYPEAARMYRLIGNKDMVAQIVNAWGQFEPVQSQAAGSKGSLHYRFRNGRQVHLQAHAIDIEKLLTDVKQYLKDNPGQLDHERLQIDNIGHYIVTRDQDKYLTGKVADWKVKLEPREHHFDKRIEIETPLTKAGAYLVTAEMADGNTSRIVLWLADTVIVNKPLDKQTFYYVADAVTSQPVAGANMEFFGFKTEYVDNKLWKALGRRHNVLTRNFAEHSDANGQVILGPERLSREYQWLVIARTKEGRLAHLGFNGIWYAKRYDQEYRDRKILVITDRPVYRPNQPVKFKAWIRNVRYDLEDISDLANQRVEVVIRNPKGDEVVRESYTLDAFGGINGEFVLPGDASLGQWYIEVDRHGRGNHFRVEEYKKPEFEVSVQAPTEPIALGEAFTATIKASYYFGAPVVNAKVRYKVLRESTETRWYPSAPWDWFYGPGYWWFGYDYDWYPGWRVWGCVRPSPWWWHRQSPPPELVAEQEVAIGPGGIVNVPIDTAIAKALHGDKDHRYTITAEVTDQSRRTIVGSGLVLAARRPYNVTVWVDRGYYHEGDTIEAGVAARTADHKPVAGKAELVLYHITYDEQMQPREEAVEEWSLTMGAEGSLKQKMRAGQAGQYRLSCKVTDAGGHVEEGGYIFTIRGKATDSDDFRYNAIELIPDKGDYEPGETVKLLVNADLAGSTVLLFVRPTNSIYLPPRVLKLEGKSTQVELEVSKKDMPNFFVEALTVSGGKVHTIAREIVVPPEKRMLNMEVLPSRKEYKPGEAATVRLRLTDFFGEPFSGSTVVSIYDKAVEYISGGSNVPEIRAFFWKWRREHQPRTISSLDRWFHNTVKSEEKSMQSLGAFGRQVADELTITMPFPGEMKGSRQKVMASRAASAAPMMAMEAESSMVMADGAADFGFAAGAGGTGGEEMVEPTVRTEFADTAFWAAALTTDARGEVSFELTMPENLTTWKIATWAMGHGTKVGEASAEVVTTKNVLVRLQAPRFFVEKDEVVLSANVHNYLTTAKQARVVLELDGGTLELMEGVAAEQTVTVEAEGEQRVDWRVKVVREGEAIVRMKALTDEESDAMQMSFPVKVHGLMKTVSFSGHIAQGSSSQTFEFEVPAERRVDETRLEIRYSPTLAGAMVDALPYLVDYPYGCTEQTLNRFLPTVIVQKVLLGMELDLAAVREKQTNLNAQEIGDDRERAKQWQRWKQNPVFDEAEVQRMVKVGVERLTAMQLRDGGWGWFSGWGEQSYAHTTAVVVHGLQIARENDVAIVPGVVERGIEWLWQHQLKEFEKLERGEEKKPKRPYKMQADALDAFVYMVLTDAERDHEGMRGHLYKDRIDLPVYAQAMFGIGLDNVKDLEKRDMIIRNIEQLLVRDEENQTAYLNLNNGGYWYYWYGSEYEAQAYYLKLLARTDPKGKTAPWLVKYLLNNRKHATYWNSTRDTAICIEAFAEYLRASGEDKPDLTVEVLIDGQRHQQVHITPDKLFTFDNKVVLAGDAIGSGKHTVELRKTGTGPLYFNAYLGYFSLEDYITAAGLEIKVSRTYYKLTPVEKSVKAAGSRGQAVDQRVEKYAREELRDLATLTSGDLVEIELVVESKNDYEYIVFEDYKAAGFEPVEVRSGYGGNAMGAYMELRDDRVSFFVQRLARGRHSLSYRVRAEIPGKFSALPTQAHAMYAPELKGNADEIKLKIVD